MAQVPLEVKVKGFSRSRLNRGWLDSCVDIAISFYQHDYGNNELEPTELQERREIIKDLGDFHRILIYQRLQRRGQKLQDSENSEIRDKGRLYIAAADYFERGMKRNFKLIYGGKVVELSNSDSQTKSFVRRLPI